MTPKPDDLIVFARTGEERLPKNVDYFLNNAGLISRAAGNFVYCKYPILRRIDTSTPEGVAEAMEILKGSK